jgi:F-type H+-transporting ATPase subunit g
LKEDFLIKNKKNYIIIFLHPHTENKINVIFFVPDLMTQARPQLNTFMKYARVELTPPSPGDFPAIRQGIGRLITGARTGAWKQLTVREAGLNTLVAMEVCFWFYIGECIGKRHLVGYKV